jgi:hypothetical protein
MEEKDNAQSFEPLYPRKQTSTNRKTNKDKESHLIINQHHYHMGTGNNRNDSNAQQRPVIIITWD